MRTKLLIILSVLMALGLLLALASCDSSSDEDATIGGRGDDDSDDDDSDDDDSDDDDIDDDDDDIDDDDDDDDDLGPCDDPSDCDDGLWCNGAEQCIEHQCQPGDEPCPDDDAFCNGEEFCIETDDMCGTPTPPCQDDGVFCNGQESCDEIADDCDTTGEPCFEGETCIELTQYCEREMIYDDGGRNWYLNFSDDNGIGVNAFDPEADTDYDVLSITMMWNDGALMNPPGTPDFCEIKIYNATIAGGPTGQPVYSDGIDPILWNQWEEYEMSETVTMSGAFAVGLQQTSTDLALATDSSESGYSWVRENEGDPWALFWLDQTFMIRVKIGRYVDEKYVVTKLGGVK
ncbi:MAG: hypothetical protein P9M14_10165 [Candidatus Alcyoniella australis]|nr:hypothetical protein [Candidatus Alcyoniella australis]